MTEQGCKIMAQQRGQPDSENVGGANAARLGGAAGYR